MVRKSRTSVQAAITSNTTSASPGLQSPGYDLGNNSLSDPGTLQDNEGQGQGNENPKEDEDDAEASSLANDSEDHSQTTVFVSGGASIPRKRRAGRPPKVRPQDWDGNHELDHKEIGSDIGTPKKRGGWRGRGFGSGRWAKSRGGPSHITQVPLDKEGNMATVKNDEVQLPEDPEGETKVDKMGNLLGDREYRVRVFTISGKGNRLYMLSTEPARCIGFRDSYLFFQKHRQLYKIILAEEAKRDLIERNIIPHSYKGRAIGVVTARSVFREFGARIIIGGRKIVDDYQVAAARTNGDVEGEFAVPEDTLPGGGDTYDRNRYVAWHGASSVYHSGVPSVPLVNGKTIEIKKRKVNMTGVNWMLEHAREASRFNTSLACHRRQNLHGLYDTQTNVMQYPKIMQATHARWKQSPASSKISTVQSLGISHEGRSLVKKNNAEGSREGDDGSLEGESIFPEVRSVISRNFMVTDIYYVNPPVSGLGYPGPEEDVSDVGPGGLLQVPEHIRAEMPPQCQQAYDEIRTTAMIWKAQWGVEEVDRARGQLRISYNT